MTSFENNTNLSDDATFGSNYTDYEDNFGMDIQVENLPSVDRAFMMNLNDQIVSACREFLSNFTEMRKVIGECSAGKFNKQGTIDAIKFMLQTDGNTAVLMTLVSIAAMTISRGTSQWSENNEKLVSKGAKLQRTLYHKMKSSNLKHQALSLVLPGTMQNIVRAWDHSKSWLAFRGNLDRKWVCPNLWQVIPQNMYSDYGRFLVIHDLQLKRVKVDSPENRIAAKEAYVRVKGYKDLTFVTQPRDFALDNKIMDMSRRFHHLSQAQTDTSFGGSDAPGLTTSMDWVVSVIAAANAPPQP